MQTMDPEFAPLDTERAETLRDIINRTAREKNAVMIDPNERGIDGGEPAELISPSHNVNGLVRYQRHYCARAKPRTGAR